MKILLAVLVLTLIFLSACTSKTVNATLFLKEKDQYLVNLKGNVCIESGQIINKAPDGETYRMVHVFRNCDVRLNRQMEEFELKQWAIPKQDKPEIIK